MRIATLEAGGKTLPGIAAGGRSDCWFDLELASGLLGLESLRRSAAEVDLTKIIDSAPDQNAELQTLVREISRELPSLEPARLDLRAIRFRAPLARPGKLICLAGNYREHIAESGFAVPEQSAVITPQLFLKPSSSIIGDGDDIEVGVHNGRVGWEAELAVVIGRCEGRSARNIEVRHALEHVYGYTIVNDISERRLNAALPDRTLREGDKFFDWLAGKWFDTFAPCGPWIVTKDEIADPHNLEIKLLVNGEVRQQGSTLAMIFGIPETIAYISGIMKLEPGDIISTGTPVGAGVGGAETSFSDGDTVVCEIEGIGRITNRVRSTE